jgi:DNA-binding PadR family transcriptional regulator
MHPFHDLFHSWRHRHGGHGHPHHGHHGHQFGPHGRGPRGRGFGDEGGRPGGPGRGLGGFERGRKLGSNDLQLLILALLAEQPGHGYELIKSFEQRSHGYYVPSPGMIYPALSYLDEVGHASVEQEGTKKRYSVTATGLAQVEEHRAAIDAMWAQLAQFGERMARFRAEGGAADEELDARGGRGGRGRDDALHQAIMDLRAALHETHRATPEQRARAAEIVVAAAAQIRAASQA